MKKCLIIGITLTILLTVGMVLFVNKDFGTYIVKANLVDAKSPDRLLKVYKDDQEIDYREIRKMSGTLLCESDNASVYYGEIKKEKELKIVLNLSRLISREVNNGKEVVAKIMEGE